MAAFIPQTDLIYIQNFAQEKLAENEQFKDLLRETDAESIDSMVQSLDAMITTTIDCTSCGNCCKSLMVCLNDQEANALSNHLNQSREEFDATYLEKGSNGLMIMNKMPCHFLANNRCTIYEYRFEGCKEFPALHLPNFKRRVFTTFMHYDRCPIIFNVVEQLKEKMEFERS